MRVRTLASLIAVLLATISPGHGQRRPVADHSTADGRAKDRCVERVQP